jgi:hypothetical protein
MPAKEDKREVFIEQRARALTMMLLTRRDDLLIEEVKDDIGLDYVQPDPSRPTGPPQASAR